jgi:hypothetical protein
MFLFLTVVFPASFSYHLAFARSLVALGYSGTMCVDPAFAVSVNSE